MNYTENYNLKKPAQADFVNVDDLNDNADVIDAAMLANATAISKEITRATAAEGVNAAAITAETERATAEEALKVNKTELFDLLFTTVSVIDAS